MARTYTHTPVLSSQKLGETKYYLKDADARAILDSINDDVFASLTQALGTVAGNDSKLVTAANIKSYVDQAVAVGIQIVVVETLPEASAQTKGKIYLVADTHAAGDVYDEFITIENPTGTFTWEKIGNTDIDLSGYVQKTTTIAGIDLQDNITAAELSTALDLKAMAHAAQGTATVNDYVTGVSSATTTASGTVELNAFTQTATAATLTKGDYTPAGTISTIAVIQEDIRIPDIDTSAFDGGNLENVEITLTEGSVELDSLSATPHFNSEFLYGGSFPTYTQGSDTFDAGTLPTKASDTFTANTPTTIDTTKFSGGSKASDIFNAGALPTYTQGSDSFTAATLGSATKAAFATNGIVASIDSEDDECLVFTAASTSSAVTEQGAFNGGSFTQGTDTFGAGSLPSFTEGAFTPAAIKNGFYTQGTAATFSEGAFSQGTLPSFTQGIDIYDTTDAKFQSVSESDASIEIYGDINYTSQAISSISFEFTPATIGESFLDHHDVETTEVTPTFTGTTAESILVTGVSYDKATANGATFTGAESTVDVSLTKGSKTITVNPSN